LKLILKKVQRLMRRTSCVLDGISNEGSSCANYAMKFFKDIGIPLMNKNKDSWYSCNER